MEFVERIGKQFNSALLGHAIQKRETARLKHCVVDLEQSNEMSLVWS